jgi:hypothetical protein
LMGGQGGDEQGILDDALGLLLAGKRDLPPGLGKAADARGS